MRKLLFTILLTLVFLPLLSLFSPFFRFSAPSIHSAPAPQALLQSKEWSQDGHDAQRTGYTPEEPAAPWTLLWTWNGPDATGRSGGHFYNAPREARTITGGAYVFVPAGTEGLYALSKQTGQPAWNLRQTSFNATPAYDPDTGYLYAGGANGQLYKIDTSGNVAASYVAGNPLNKAVLLISGFAYVVTDNGELHKINTATMARVWMYASGATAATLPAFSASRNMIIFCTNDLFVHAVNNSDGTRKWRVKPSPNPAGFPNEFKWYWPVIAEQHGVVFVRMRLAHDALWSGPGPGGMYPDTNKETRQFLQNNPHLKNLFALSLDTGSEQFLAAVGYGGVEDLVNGSAYLNTGPVPVIKVLPDGKEVAYQIFRNGQSKPPDGRWDSHIGEMVLDDQTVSGMVAGDLRFVRWLNPFVITDEQTPLTMAGDTLFHAHWGASESVRITDRSAQRGLSYSTPIETSTHPTIIRRQQACSSYTPNTHWTTCGLTLYGDGRYWKGPGWWVYWDILDPPTPVRNAYSEGILPRYTYVSDGLVIVEGNGGELFVLRHSGSTAPTTTPISTRTPPPTSTRTSLPTNTRTATATSTRTPVPTSTPMTTTTPVPTGIRTSTPTGAPVSNLVSNGTFENGTLSGWEKEGTVAIVTDQVHAGSYAARVAGAGARLRGRITTSAGSAYDATVWLKIVNETGSDWGGFRVSAKDTTTLPWTDLAISSNLLQATHGVQWFQVRLPFTARSSSTVIDIEYFGGANRVMDVRVDDVVVVRRQPTSTAPPTATRTPTNIPTATRTAIPTATRTPTSISTATRTSTPVPVTTTPASIVNLITNGTFESGSLAGWQIMAGSPSTITDPHTGSYAAALPNADLRTTLNTTPGTIYKVTAWVKIIRDTPLGSDAWGGFRILASDSRTAPWSTLADTGPVIAADYGNSWFKIALSFTAVASSTPINIGYFGGSRSMDIRLDDVVIFVKGASNQPPSITNAALNPVTSTSPPQDQQYNLVVDDPDGAVVRVLWDFGDGTRALQGSGTRRVAIPGTYTARVQVSDDDGAVTERRIAWSVTGSGFPILTVGTPFSLTTTTDNPTLSMNGTASGSGVDVRISTDRGFVGLASGSATWSANVPLQPGYNRILVQAKDANGRVVTTERVVRYIPSSPLGISNLSESATTLGRWELFQVTFSLNNSAATDPQFPYDPEPPRGLEWMDGISVEALFTPDNWVTVYRRPAFLYQRYDRALKGDQEWMYANGEPLWAARFAPPSLGVWKYRIEVREAKGAVQSSERSFSVVASSQPNNHGPVGLTPADSRYFVFADGTTFLGTGHNIGVSPDSFSYDAINMLSAMGSGNQQLLRWWVSREIWGSAWQPWRSRTLSTEISYLPATALTLDRAFGNGLVSLKLSTDNPIMFQGFQSGRAALIPGRTYRLRVRWRTEAISGPATSGQPYGATIKLTGWPEPGQTSAIPALIPHVSGDTPWHVAAADFTATSDLLPNLALILENSTSGAAYVDEVALHEVQSNGTLGPQLLRNPRFNAHLTFDLRRGSGMDAIFAAADTRGVYYKLVISEKDEFLLNHLGAEGLPDRQRRNFNNGPGSPTYWLHQAYWRHLFARFGAYRSIHSWELVNEAPPGPGDHFRLTAALAKLSAADGNPHLASTSTYASLATNAWKAPDSAPISYVDFHAYVRTTGWIEPREELANDSARHFSEYDRAARAEGFNKPVIWGEQGINDVSTTDLEDPLVTNDTSGVWLHKITWARCGPGGVYPLYWYTNNIFNKSLHSIYGNWNRFMADIPLANGRYQDAAATVSNPSLRVLGQKDLTNGRAHLWIDNKQHTWKAVVSGTSISSQSGTVQVTMQPNIMYTATWYNTRTGQISTTQSVTANSTGLVSLNVSTSTDIAVKLAR